MTEIESSLRSALEAYPEDWSTRMLVVDKMIERDAGGEAVNLLLEATTPPDTEEQLQRLVEITEENGHDLVYAYVERNPDSVYAHQLLGAIYEWMGEAERSQHHLSVAEAIESGAYQAGAVAQGTPPPPPPVTNASDALPMPPPLMEPTAVTPMMEEGADQYVEETLNLSDLAAVEPPKQRGKKATAIMAAFIVHAVIFLIAALVVILPPMKKDPEIVAAIAPTVQKKQEMQKKNVVKQTKKSSASAAAAAPLAQLMRANAVAKISLPNVTKTSKGPLGIGDADFGGGGFGSGGGGMGSGASFFGGTSTGKRFLFVIDHSGSMRRNQVELRNNELEKALKSLKGVQYQVLLFAGGAYFASKGWELKTPGRDVNTVKGPKGEWDFVSVAGAGNFDYKGPAEKLPRADWLSTTPTNVRRTMEKINEDRLFYGTDWGLALDIGHRMQPPPDVIFFMSDGTGGNSPPPILEINKKFGRPPINTVAMQTTAGIQQFAEIAKQTKGSFTIVDKDGKPIDGFEYIKNPGKFTGRL